MFRKQLFKLSLVKHFCFRCLDHGPLQLWELFDGVYEPIRTKRSS